MWWKQWCGEGREVGSSGFFGRWCWSSFLGLITFSDFFSCVNWWSLILKLGSVICLAEHLTEDGMALRIRIIEGWLMVNSLQCKSIGTNKNLIHHGRGGGWRETLLSWDSMPARKTNESGKDQIGVLCSEWKIGCHCTWCWQNCIYSGNVACKSSRLRKMTLREDALNARVWRVRSYERRCLDFDLV